MLSYYSLGEHMLIINNVFFGIEKHFQVECGAISPQF